MPRSTKKRKPNEEPEPESSTTSEDDDDDIDEDEDEEQQSTRPENIQIDLEARTPIDTDQSAIVYFLEQSFGHPIKKSVLDLQQLATQLVTQQTCGSVFYQPSDASMDADDEDEDEDESPVLGICSILRFDQQLNKQLHTWLTDKCSDNQQAKTILQSSKCALLVNERYLNIPAEISLPAVQTLREEIPFQLDFWIVHAKLRLHKTDSNTIYYVNGEEEVFQQHSTTFVDYYPPQADGNEWTHRRRILFVPTSKLDQICSDIEQKLKQ